MSAVLDLFRLDDKVAVVTGASSGLGVSFAGALADASTDVVLAARRVEKLEDTKEMVESKGRRAITVACDVSDPAACAAVAAAAIENFGHLDILVNNAGIADSAPATREAPEEFDRVIQTNLNGTFYMAQACARAMKNGGSIVNIASILGLTSGADAAGRVQRQQGRRRRTHPRPGTAVVGSQGHRQRHRPRILCLRDDLRADRGGYMQTFVIPRTLFGRLGNEGELNPALIFLASDASSYVTGITLPVDGGSSPTERPLCVDHPRRRDSWPAYWQTTFGSGSYFTVRVRLLISAPVFASVITRVSRVVNPFEPLLGMQSSPAGKVTFSGSVYSDRLPVIDCTSTVLVPHRRTVIALSDHSVSMTMP